MGLNQKFDLLLIKFFRWFGLNKFYANNLWFRQFVRYGITTTVIYWFAKAPLIWILTEKFGIWYLGATFIIGLIITLIGFVVEKFYVFRR